MPICTSVGEGLVDEARPVPGSGRTGGLLVGESAEPGGWWEGESAELVE